VAPSFWTKNSDHWVIPAVQAMLSQSTSKLNGTCCGREANSNIPDQWSTTAGPTAPIILRSWWHLRTWKCFEVGVVCTSSIRLSESLPQSCVAWSMMIRVADNIQAQ
jgi:hypothetical protein